MVKADDSAHGGTVWMGNGKAADGKAANGLASSAGHGAAFGREGCGPPPYQPPLDPVNQEVYRLHLPATETHADDRRTKDEWVKR